MSASSKDSTTLITHIPQKVHELVQHGREGMGEVRKTRATVVIKCPIKGLIADDAYLHDVRDQEEEGEIVFPSEIVDMKIGSSAISHVK